MARRTGKGSAAKTPKRASRRRGSGRAAGRAEDLAVQATAETSGAGTQPGAPWWRRAWNRATAAVLAAGALAGAVTAVLALWPDPDPADSARFTSVSVFSPVSLSEYQQRTVTFQPLGAGRSPDGVGVVLAATTSTAEPSPTGSTPTPTPTGSATASTTATPTASASPSGTASATATATPTAVTPDPTRGVRQVAGDVLSRVVEQAPQYGLEALLDDVRPPLSPTPLPPTAGPTPTGSPTPGRLPSTVFAIVVAAATDEDGDPVEPDEAAERVVELLGETRTVDEGPGDQEPLGVVVDVNLELEGLRGQPVDLSWSIFPQGGGQPLFGEWLNNFPAYRLEATSNRDSASLDLWLPLPKDPGPYVARLRLAADDTGIASTSTEPFG